LIGQEEAEKIVEMQERDMFFDIAEERNKCAIENMKQQNLINLDDVIEGMVQRDRIQKSKRKTGTASKSNTVRQSDSNSNIFSSYAKDPDDLFSLRMRHALHGSNNFNVGSFLDPSKPQMPHEGSAR